MPIGTRVIVSIGAIPLLVTRPAPLQDWPNHLARLHILVGLVHGDPFWTRLYALTGFFVPNAVLDLGLLGLTSAGMTQQAAGQVFILATYVAFVGGFCALAAALDAGPGKPVLAVLLFYDHALFWGLVSYVLAVGLMLGLLAVWLVQPRRSRRLAVAAAGAAVLFFTHAVAAFVWPLLLACLEFAAPRPRRRWTVRRLAEHGSSITALAIAAILLRASTGDGHDLALVYAGRGVRAVVAHKLWAFADIVLGGSLPQDASSVLACLVCAGACAARPFLSAAAATAVVALVFLTLAAPERLGTGSQLDARLAILPLVVLSACVRVPIGRRALGVMTAAVAARTLILAAYWHAAGAVFLDYRRATASLPPGGLMMMATGTRLSTLSWQRIWSPPVTSIATQLVFRGLFVPSIFANPREQPIALRHDSGLGQPWDLTDAAHIRAALPALAGLCATGGFSGVFLTVLYPGGVAAHHEGFGLVSARPDFLVLDACRRP